MIIGMCGGSASGKSTIIELLKERFRGQVAVIDMDNYYISRDELPFEERRLVNYDIPESLDWESMLRDIQLLKKGEQIEQPKFTFLTYKRMKETVATDPAPILIIDGIFSFHREEMRQLYDLKVFVDAPADVRLARRILRNMELYGRPAEFEIEQYFDKVKPMHEKYVEPCRNYADLILSFENRSMDSLALFIEKIEQIFLLENERKLKELI